MILENLSLKVPNLEFDFDASVSAVNRYIEVEFDFEYSFARHDNDS